MSKPNQGSWKKSLTDWLPIVAVLALVVCVAGGLYALPKELDKEREAIRELTQQSAVLKQSCKDLEVKLKTLNEESLKYEAMIERLRQTDRDHVESILAAVYKYRTSAAMIADWERAQETIKNLASRPVSVFASERLVGIWSHSQIGVSGNRVMECKVQLHADGKLTMISQFRCDEKTGQIVEQVGNNAEGRWISCGATLVLCWRTQDKPWADVLTVSEDGGKLVWHGFTPTIEPGARLPGILLATKDTAQ
jgi:uncharacterized protein YoxC